MVEKHPEPAPIYPSHSLLTSTPPPDHDPHFIEFHRIDGVLIRSILMLSIYLSHSLLTSTPPPDHDPHFIEFHRID